MAYARVIGALAGVVIVASLVAWGCGGAADSPANLNQDGGGGDGDNGETGPNFNDDAGGGDAGQGCDESCPSGLACVHGVCVPPQSGCKSGQDCRFDTYCDDAGACIPYGSLPDNKTSDPTCGLAVPPGAFSPKLKCQFPIAVPIAGDPFPNHVDVQTTPIVVSFTAAGPPSIVAAFTVPVVGSYTENQGVIRILRGTDCTQEAVLGGVDLDGDAVIDWARSPSPVAVADLDGDKMPEIVAYMAGGGGETMMAFTKKTGVWAPLWATKKATQKDGVTIFKYGTTTWAGPAIHDLDDDGIPEIIREGYVFDGLTGRQRSDLPPNYASYSQGIPAVLANLDADPKIEMTNGARMWEWSGATNLWVEEPTYLQTTPSPPGWAAVADFNPFDGLKKPEIAVASSGKLTIFDTTHTVFMNMAVLVPGGGGGPPTIADYDGDGLPEVGLAGQAYYTVFDPDCQAAPRTGGKCVDRTHCDFAAGGACPDYILWSKGTQDISSNITGSSVFDFEADGKAEVVYADECFARVYSGSDGHVLFSRYHSSCTWLENPVVADVDGDFRSELVVPNNTACGAIGVGKVCVNQWDAVNLVDTQFPGLVCLVNADCVSNVCDNGLCRCTTSAECCADKDDAKCLEFGTKCAPPPAGTPGTGKTCRAGHPHGTQGIRVYKDSADRWVRSRKIWNQQSYAVTHVNEDGTIPKTSLWANNWTTPGLNNFRQNVPGNADGKAIGDLTSQAGPFFACDGPEATLSDQICNRGTAPVGAGIAVAFYLGADKVCTTTTAGALAVGACEKVSCIWSAPPATAASAATITVVPNDDGAVSECDTKNDNGELVGVFCAPPK